MLRKNRFARIGPIQAHRAVCGGVRSAGQSLVLLSREATRWISA